MHHHISYSEVHEIKLDLSCLSWHRLDTEKEDGAACAEGSAAQRVAFSVGTPEISRSHRIIPTIFHYAGSSPGIRKIALALVVSCPSLAPPPSPLPRPSLPFHTDCIDGTRRRVRTSVSISS